MILPDVNVLIYAYLEDADHHDVYRRWLESARLDQELLLPDTVLTGFLRIVTNRRLHPVPAPIAEALAFTTALATDGRFLDHSPTVWRAFAGLVADDRQIAGNRVPDAYLAGVAISHNALLATRDRDFGRFPGLRWFDPAATAG